MKSDYQCQECNQEISSDMAQMTLDTVLKFIGEGSGRSANPAETVEVMANLVRFLPETNHLMVDLKLRFIDQVLANQDERKDHEPLALKYCQELLELARDVAPGHSKIRGVLSLRFHQLTQNGPNPLVISKVAVEQMFDQDQSVTLLE